MDLYLNQRIYYTLKILSSMPWFKMNLTIDKSRISQTGDAKSNSSNIFLNHNVGSNWWKRQLNYPSNKENAPVYIK